MSRRAFIIGIVLITVLAAGLRFWKAGQHSFWLDEVVSLRVAEKDLSEWGKILPSDTTPPLHYLLKHGCLRLFGTHEFAARLPSVLFGILTVPLLAHFTYTLFGPPAGLVSGLMLALSPIHIAYSQEARPYALMAFGVLASFWWLERVLRCPTRQAALGYTLSLIALPYTHNWGIFVVASHIVYLALFQRRNAFVRQRGLWVLLAFTAAFAVWLPTLWSQAHSPMLEGMAASSRHDLGRIFRAWAGVSFTVGEEGLRQPTAWRNLGMTLFLAPLALIILSLSKNVIQSTWFDKLTMIKELPRWNAVAMLLTGILVTVLIPYLISFKFPILQVDRHPVIVLPLFMALVAWGTGFLSRALLGAWIGAWVLYSAFVLYPMYTTWTKSYSRQIAHFLRAELNPADRAWFLPGYEAIPIDQYFFAPRYRPDQPIPGGKVVLFYNREAFQDLAKEARAQLPGRRIGERRFGNKVLEFYE